MNFALGEFVEVSDAEGEYDGDAKVIRAMGDGQYCVRFTSGRIITVTAEQLRRQ